MTASPSSRVCKVPLVIFTDDAFLWVCLCVLQRASRSCRVPCRCCLYPVRQRQVCPLCRVSGAICAVSLVSPNSHRPRSSQQTNQFVVTRSFMTMMTPAEVRARPACPECVSLCHFKGSFVSGILRILVSSRPQESSTGISSTLFLAC